MKKFAFVGIAALVALFAATALANDAKEPTDSLQGLRPEGSTWIDKDGKHTAPSIADQLKKKKAELILKVHNDEVMNIPGVKGFGISEDEQGNQFIFIYVDPVHGPLPDFIEDLPIKSQPTPDLTTAHHTFSGSQVRPHHVFPGAV